MSTLPVELLNELRTRGLTLGTAESCTGGNIAHRITEVAGCSDVFMGGVVSYDNSVKHNVLGVKNETLERFGAVSRETVCEMLSGTIRVVGTDCAVATSGIAGPGGGSEEKPVGTVWIGAQISGAEPDVRLFHFNGTRKEIIEQATEQALIMMLELLK